MCGSSEESSPSEGHRDEKTVESEKARVDVCHVSTPSSRDIAQGKYTGMQRHPQFILCSWHTNAE
jgi:hypothetical protein